jgi:hypothetical protein
VFGVVSINNYQRQLDDEQLAGVLAASSSTVPPVGGWRCTARTCT